MAFADADTARNIYRRVLDSFDRRDRQRLRFKNGTGRSQSPNIYFLAPDYDRPSGGTMVLYRHIDILNAAGISALALHRRSGFRYSWFDNDTRRVDLAEITLTPNDIVVFPETDVDLVEHLPKGVRYIIFNQNSHFTWRHGSAVSKAYAVNRPGFLGVIAVSEHNRMMLHHAFPDVRVARVHLGLDGQRFTAARSARHRLITYMPRRGRADVELVLHILKERKSLDGWNIVPLDGLHHDQVAEELRKSSIFLASSYQEGFGLPAAEAMACGNYVIGYHGLAGREFFDPAFSAPIEAGDVVAFACAVEQAIKSEAASPGWCREKGLKASAFVLGSYGQERERSEVVAAYSELCELPVGAGLSSSSELEAASS